MVALHARWCAFAKGLTEVAGQEIIGPPTTSHTPKRQYWRCKLAAGSKATLAFEPAMDTKTQIGVEHLKLTDAAATEAGKAAWATLFAKCFGTL